jgi:phosphate:Na+ symporter
MALMAALVHGDLVADRNAITLGLALFHTVFNALSTLLFLPFVNQIAALCKRFFKDEPETTTPETHRYEFVYTDAMQRSPELALIRAEKEIRDMAHTAREMYQGVVSMLTEMGKNEMQETEMETFVTNMKAKEEYADDMREQLTLFIISCSEQLSGTQNERRVSTMLRIISNLEDMADECFAMVKILERCVKKDRVFKTKELDSLTPFMDVVKDFLLFISNHLGSKFTSEELSRAKTAETQIETYRNKLRKMSRKRIEAGEDVKTELLFIDMVKRIEHVGDYCYSISSSMSRL